MRNLACTLPCVIGLWLSVATAPSFAQAVKGPPAKPISGPPAKPAVDEKSAGVPLPAGYRIGADDALTVRFWKDADLSGDVVVRPDGKITLALLNDVQAAGYTPQELAVALEKAATKFITDPSATVIVREIRSRKVYVIGSGIARGGVIQLNDELNVLQVLAMAGGLQEYADKSNIVIIRKEEGREKRFKFNYNEVVKGKNIKQNILLQPGDTIVVN